MKPDDIHSQWRETTALERAHMAKAFLAIHGFITAAESEKIHQRIVKWIQQSRKESAE